MKMKLLTLTVIVVGILTIGSATAAPDPATGPTCIGGTYVTAGDGHQYCQSDNSMNWWSAASWCEAQGRRLVSVGEICPEFNKGENNCTYYNSLSNISWTSTPYQTDYALYVYGDGSGSYRYSRVNFTARTADANYRALCN